MDDGDLHGVTVTPFFHFITFSQIKSKLSATHVIALASMPNINYDLLLVFHGSFYISFTDKQEILKQ